MDGKARLVVGPGGERRESGLARDLLEFGDRVFAGNLGQDPFPGAEIVRAPADRRLLGFQAFQVHFDPAFGLVVERDVAKGREIEIRAEFGVELAIRTIFEMPTVAAMVRKMESSNAVARATKEYLGWGA